MSAELTIVIASACGLSTPIGLFARRTIRRWRTPTELRGDWWPRFENDFRGYVSKTRHRHGANGGDWQAKSE